MSDTRVYFIRLIESAFYVLLLMAILKVLTGEEEFKEGKSILYSLSCTCVYGYGVLNHRKIK